MISIEEEWYELIDDHLIPELQMISVIDHSQLHFSLLKECPEANPVLFVQISLIKRDHFTILSYLLEMLRLLGVDRGVVLELDEHHLVQRGEAREVLVLFRVLFLVVNIRQKARVPQVFVVVRVDAAVTEVASWSEVVLHHVELNYVVLKFC